jgi:drug/metabolite transporter (DMT)-like permease
MRLRTLLGLIAANLVWSAHPAMGKLVLESVTPAHGAWFRYAGALAAYLVAMAALRAAGSRARLGPAFLAPSRAADWGWLVILGFFTFCFSPLLQMTGLRASRATDNSLIIAIEPLMTVLVTALVVRQRPQAYHWFSFALALTGFSLLAGLSPGRVLGGWDPHVWGNVILLVSLLGEAVYSAVGLKLVPRYPSMAVFGSALAVGVLLLTAGTWLYAGPPAFGDLSARSAFGLLWLGPLGTTATYLYWMIVLPEAPVASLAVTLFIQPLLGAVWGYVFLGERLTPVQAAGGALILLAVVVPVWVTAGARRYKRPAVVPPGPL